MINTVERLLKLLERSGREVKRGNVCLKTGEYLSAFIKAPKSKRHHCQAGSIPELRKN
jgi:hypothetical protein